jgi:hypothetical protein
MPLQSYRFEPAALRASMNYAVFFWSHHTTSA